MAFETPIIILSKNVYCYYQLTQIQLLHANNKMFTIVLSLAEYNDGKYFKITFISNAFPVYEKHCYDKCIRIWITNDYVYKNSVHCCFTYYPCKWSCLPGEMYRLISNLKQPLLMQLTNCCSLVM